jgi:hypothetical protein
MALAFFLSWVQDNVPVTEEFKDSSFIEALNKQCRESYTDEAFQSITGYKIEDLFIYYQISIQD